MSAERLDSLIDSLASLEIRANELDELTALACADEECAARFDHALAMERTIRRGAAGVEQVAAGVSIRPTHGAQRRAGTRGRPSPALAASWMLTAASLALAVVLAGRTQAIRPVLVEGHAPSILAPAGEEPPAQAVITELPLVPLGLRRVGSGEMEMVYVRPRVEQAEVSALYRVARDEHGRAVAVRAEVAPAGREAM